MIDMIGRDRTDPLKRKLAELFDRCIAREAEIERLKQENAALKTELESYQRGTAAINEAVKSHGCYKP